MKTIKQLIDSHIHPEIDGQKILKFTELEVKYMIMEASSQAYIKGRFDSWHNDKVMSNEELDNFINQLQNGER